MADHVILDYEGLPCCYSFLRRRKILLKEKEIDKIRQFDEKNHKCFYPFNDGMHIDAIIDFDDIEITDDADDGIIAATVINSIYKGSYYQCLLKTDDNFIFFSDTDDDWLKGDRIGIRIPKDKIIIEEINEENESN